MAFNNRNSNKNNRVNTTTKIIQLYNDNAGDDSSTMRLGLWNDYVSININPILPKAEQVDGKIYNYEKTASTLLTLDNVFQIYTGIKLLEKEELNEKKTGKAKKVSSISVISNNVLVKIGGAGEYDGIDSKYISLWSLNESGQTDGNAFYIFTNPENGLMINYDEETGSFKNKTVNTQWEQFKAFIEYCVENLINGSAHGSNKSIDYHCTKIGSLIETTKALVENIISGSSNISNNSNSNGSGFGNNFGGSRKRRSSMNLLSEEDLKDDEETLDDLSDVEEDEIDFDEYEEKVATAKKKKASSKKSSSKKISADDIASDMESELDDDMSDLD